MRSMTSVLISVVVVVFIGSALFDISNAEDCKGCVPLDSYSFDKVIKKFKATIVKFDVAFPYGEKHEAYASVAQDTRDIENLLMAEVGVKDYGNKDNSDLAKRFNIDRKDFPVIMLFTQEDGSQPQRLIDGHDDNFTAENLKRLIRTNAGVYIGLAGCIEELDRLTEEFMKAGEEERRTLLDTAKRLQDSLSESKRPVAQTYVKIMEKILERGDEFIQSEQTRIEGILKGKLSPYKKRTIEEKRNILQSFHYRDEL